MNEYNEVIKEIDMDGNIYEVAIVKAFDLLYFTIDVEASKPTPYNLNDNQLKIPNKFLITQIMTRAETNALAGFMLKINGMLYPSKSYFLDASNKLATQSLGVYTKLFYCATTMNHYKNLNIKINEGDLLKFYVYNTHTSPQEIYVHLIGYRIFEKVLKPIP